MNDEKDILVIDDDPDIAEYCRSVLEGHGYRVRSAVSAEEGAAALRAHRPDLVILDVMMESPDSGFLFANTIDRDFSGLPVILFSSIASASMRLFDTSTLPVAAIIEKPVEPAELLATVQKTLKETP